jgi:hypothetical protein
VAGRDPFHDFATCSFGGVTCAQQWCDFYLWEVILNTHQHLRGIVELGSWEGGMSRYLFSQAKTREMDFVTFDSIQPAEAPRNFIRLDIYRFPEKVSHEANHMGGPVALFCDGGNKPRELRTFPPLMPEGSIFVVHDWGTETQPEDVPDFLEEIHGEFCDELRSISRVFKMAA